LEGMDQGDSSPFPRSQAFRKAVICKRVDFLIRVSFFEQKRVALLEKSRGVLPRDDEDIH